MPAPIQKNKLFMSLFFLIAACTTNSALISTSAEDKFAAISVGDDEQKVEKIWGVPERGHSDYGSVKTDTLNYFSTAGGPGASFDVDLSSKRVLSKTQWLTANSTFDLDKKVRSNFAELAWTKYIPCHTRSDQDEILVNRDKGIIIDIGGYGSGTISWSTSAFISARIDLIVKTCPRLQIQTAK